MLPLASREDRPSWGIPAHIRSDNGPEFCAEAVRGWLDRLSMGTLFIDPGSPWENGYIGSIIEKLRDKEARISIEQWKQHYNGVCPHSSLGYRPPAPETIAFPGMRLPGSWSLLGLQAGPYTKI